MADDNKPTEFNPDLNKFEMRDDVMETLLNVLSKRIHDNLPPNVRFSLFLFQEQEEAAINIFYCSTAKSVETIPLIETWIRRQVQ